MYDEFSRVYDELIFDIDYEKYANTIWEALIKRGFQGETLIELGCGTGNLTQILAQKVDHIFALDLSEEMLSMAWNKLGEKGIDNVSLSCQNMVDFEAPKAQACVSLLDTFNYVSLEDLRKTFYRVWGHLEEGGIFAFDINSKYRLFEEIGNKTWLYETEQIFYTWESQIEEDKVYSWLSFFVLQDNGLYKRIDEDQVQYYHSIDQVSKLLDEVGFEKISFMDLDTEGELEDQTQRILHFCQKSN